MIPSMIEAYPDEFKRAIAVVKGGKKVYRK